MALRFIILYKTEKDLKTTFSVVEEVTQLKAIKKLCQEKGIPNIRLDTKDDPRAGVYSCSCLDDYNGIIG